jgi:hypothetical protein
MAATVEYCPSESFSFFHCNSSLTRTQRCLPSLPSIASLPSQALPFVPAVVTDKQSSRSALAEWGSHPRAAVVGKQSSRGAPAEWGSHPGATTPVLGPPGPARPRVKTRQKPAHLGVQDSPNACPSQRPGVARAHVQHLPRG